MAGTLVITGGSRGIGAATAKLAARRGYGVAILYLGRDRDAAATIAEIERQGGRAIAVKGDVAREGDVVRLFDEAAARLGPLAGLVNNASIIGGASRVADVTAEALRAVMEVNVIGAFLCAREAVKRLSTARGGNGGAIVNITSMAAEIGGAGEYVHYAASKGAIETMTVGLAREVARESIRVNAVSPGMIHTEIHAEAGMPDRIARLAPSVPMGRGGEPGEVAEAVLWLLSDAASYVTGASLHVSGGR
ncbi:MAG TPA: SDR family oxidoreductase [Alphaproteobacteria bacterium]|nr:SDR family oxidoreductase [Alphaproteobacteria bacterium]